ncbi:MAG: beta-ribofuranosylaminobenzene 5'-phosphate synthase family protein [Candidatus Saliniplasma sp.]
MIIKTPSRLHMGIIDLSREFIRSYGALGLTIKDGFTIEVETIEKDLRVKASKRNVKDVRKVYNRIKKDLKIKNGFRVRVEEDIPRHVGLGSTTQLCLGTGFAMAKLSGHDIDPIKLAKMIGRARFSAIGTYGFKHGGFILEGGKSAPMEVPPLLFQNDIPEDWRFIIISANEWEGFDESEEQPIMEELKVSKRFPQIISHHIVMGILPALKARDIEDFGYHMTHIQKTVGKSFSDYQQGIFHPAVGDIINELKKHTYGVGQSSWGPTIYGLTTADKAHEVKNKMKEWLTINDKNTSLRIAEPENKGVRLFRSDHD